MTTKLSSKPSLGDDSLAEPELPPSPIRQKVTARAFWIGLVIALSICAIMPYNDYYIGATYLSGNYFPIGGVFAILLVVLGINPLLIACGKRAKIFSPAEIMTIWAMIITVSGIPSSGLMRYLIPHVVGIPYYSTPQNGYDNLIMAHLPQRLFVTDPGAVQTFFKGLNRGEAIPWSAWATPMAWWGLFVALLFLGFFCLSTLLRRQWMDNERFTFPLVKLPTMMAESPEPGFHFNSLMRSPLLWATVAAVTLLHTLKGMHLFYPAIPDIPLSWSSGAYLTTKPWNAASFEIAIYPLVIGFSYLLASDVCLSLWLFYVLFIGQQILANQYAWDVTQPGTGWLMGPGFCAYEEVGGALALAVYVIWSMRAHLRNIWTKAIWNDKRVDDSDEPLSYRFALLGFAVAFGGMFCWLVFAAGMQTVMAAGVVVGAFVVFIMLSWLVAQAGLLFAQQAYSPGQVTTVFVGTSPFGAQSLGMASIVEHVGWQDAREFMMPSLLNSYKAASETRLDARSLTKALGICVFLAVLIAGAASIWLPYTHGGALALRDPWGDINAPNISLTWTASVLKSPHAVNTSAILNIVAGAAFVGFLFVCRAFIPSFAIHPAGFLVAATYPIYAMWFSLLIGWALKVPIMRYGGMRGYRLLLPVFLGLILGDCMNAIVWSIVGIVTHTGYRLMPG